MTDDIVVCRLHPDLQAQFTELMAQFHDLKMSVLRIVAVALSAVTGVVTCGVML